MTTYVYWIKRSFRVLDNAVLAKLQLNNVVCVSFESYTETIKTVERGEYPDMFRSCSNRVGFVQDCELELHKSLSALGSRLLVARISPEQGLAKICAEICQETGEKPILVTDRLYSYEEDELSNKMGQHLKEIDVIQDILYNQTYLIDHSLMLSTPTLAAYMRMFNIDKMTEQYYPRPSKLQTLELNGLRQTGYFYVPMNHSLYTSSIKGGEPQALAQAKEFSTRYETYIEDRSVIWGQNGSGMEPYLYWGCISRRVLIKGILGNAKTQTQRIAAREYIRELMFTEWFVSLYLFNGPKKWYSNDGIKPLGTNTRGYNTADAKAILTASTGEPVIDSMINQLMLEGYLGNRNRMVLCSYICNNLDLIHKFGAALFEQYLIGHNTIVNYANWMWGAGLGTDSVEYPGRTFGLGKLYNNSGQQYVSNWSKGKDRVLVETGM